MQDIQQYIDFFNFSKTLATSPDLDNDIHKPVAKNIIIANIMLNFCALYFLIWFFGPYSTADSIQQPDVNTIAPGGTETLSLSKIAIAVACWGMPPNYLRRFHAAYDVYLRTFQPASWQSFLDQVRKERAAANVVVSSRLPPFFFFFLVSH